MLKLCAASHTARYLSAEAEKRSREGGACGARLEPGELGVVDSCRPCQIVISVFPAMGLRSVSDKQLSSLEGVLEGEWRPISV